MPSVFCYNLDRFGYSCLQRKMSFHIFHQFLPLKFSYIDFSNRQMFCRKLQDMPMSEVIYLLTTFANMATSRGMEEEQFIRFVAKELYQITYVDKDLREQFSKTGRELLYTVTACHPFTMSHLLSEVEQTVDAVGNVRKYSKRYSITP